MNPEPAPFSQPLFLCAALLLFLSLRATAQTAVPLAPGAEPRAYTSLPACLQALRSSPPPSDTQAMPEPFRVLSWNTQKLAQPGALKLLSQLGSRSDVLMLQEAIWGLHARDAKQAWRSFSPGYRRGDSISGVEIRSRIPFDLHCNLQMQEPWLRTPKALAVVRLPFASQSVLLVNIHAINFTLGSRAYRKQFASIGRLLEIHQGPAIVGGDLNNWNAGRQRVLEKFAQQHQLHQVSFTPDWRSRHIGKPVDGILLRDLQLVDATAYPTQLSDHNPVGVSLTKRPKRRPPKQSAAETSSSVPANIGGHAEQQEQNDDARR